MNHIETDKYIIHEGDYIEYSTNPNIKRKNSRVKKILTKTILLTERGDKVDATSNKANVINKVKHHTTGYDHKGNITHKYI